jgi:phytoene dehydrogenase-like protein
MKDGRSSEAGIVVVGGGLAGLTAAALLARGGRRVTLFEGGQLGGRATTQERNGFRFNFGPHALYRAGALSRVLEQLGVRITGKSPGSPGAALRGGKRHLLPRDPETLARTSLFGPESRMEATSVLAAVPRLNPDELAKVSVGEWLQELRHEEVRQFITALIRLSTFSGDERQSMGAVAAQLQLGLAGVLYLDEGWASIVLELDRVAREAGAEIRSGNAVTAVEHEGGVRGVRLQDGTFYQASAVILAVGPSTAARLAGHGTVLDAWADSLIPVRLASLDIGLRRLPDPGSPFALGLEEPLYFSVHAPAARLAPEGAAMVHVARYLRTDEEPGADVEAELEELLEVMQPGWRAELTERRFLRHTTVTNALPTAAMGGTGGRPGPAVPGIPNLYVAGDWVGPQGLLSDASAASAELAASLLLGGTLHPPVRDYALA